MQKLLLKYRLKSFFGAFNKIENRGRSILLLVSAIFILVFISGFFYQIYAFAVSNPEQGEAILRSFASLALHGIFVFLSFYGLSFAIFGVFFSRDLRLLLSLPIKSFDVFIFKMIESIFLSSRFAFLVFIPLIIVMGAYYSVSPLFYPLGIIVTLLLSAIPGMLGITAASFFARRISRGNLKNILAVIGSLLGIGIWTGINLIRPGIPSGGLIGNPRIFESLDETLMPTLDYLPSGWAARSLSAAAAGDWGTGILFLAILTITAGILGFLAYKSTAHYYSGGVVEESPEASISGSFGFLTGVSPLLAHMKRDLIIMFREFNALVQSLIMFIFLILFPFVVGRSPDSKGLFNVSSPIGSIFIILLGYQIGMRMIPIERLGFWINMTTPGGLRLAVLGKTIVGLLFVTILAISAGTIHLMAGAPGGVGYILMLIGFSWAGMAIGLPLGLFFGDFNWDNPNRMIKSGGIIRYVILLTILIGLLGVVAGILGAGTFSSINSGLIIVFFSLVLLAASLAISTNKLTNFEWRPEV